jgi:hypothetical protein
MLTEDEKGSEVEDGVLIGTDREKIEGRKIVQHVKN